VVARFALARYEVITSDGSALVPAKKPEPVGMLVKALARAWRWHKECVSLYTTCRGALPLKPIKQWASFEMPLTCRSILADMASDARHRAQSPLAPSCRSPNSS
jgi:hypothetical protein